MKTVRCLSDWSTYKVYFCLLLCWFYLIETRAFSVLSEGWSCVAMPPWDGTKRKVWNSSCMNTNGQRVDDCLFTPILSRFISGPVEFASPVSLPFLFVTLSCLLPHRRRIVWCKKQWWLLSVVVATTFVSCRSSCSLCEMHQLLTSVFRVVAVSATSWAFHFLLLSLFLGRTVLLVEI